MISNLVELGNGSLLEYKAPTTSHMRVPAGTLPEREFRARGGLGPYWRPRRRKERVLLRPTGGFPFALVQYCNMHTPPD